MKPLCCRDRRDAELLLAAGSDGLTIDEVNPVWLKTPAAPIVGSLMEKVDIDVGHILAAFHSLQKRVQHVIVEGQAGGWSRFIVIISPRLPESRGSGLVLNNAQEMGDIAAQTDADILRKILDVPILVGLGENLTELPADWRVMLDSTVS